MDNDENAKEEFNFMIAQKKEFCAVSLMGILNGKSNKKIEQCIEELSTMDCRYFILNFREITRIDPTAYRLIVQLQHSIRSNEDNHLRLSGLNPAFKSGLSDNGIIRPNEVVNNVKEAINSLSNLS